ncbi:MAG: hypothetical protein SGBAC_013533, partial [Bacillariaceae sp.]
MSAELQKFFSEFLLEEEKASSDNHNNDDDETMGVVSDDYDNKKMMMKRQGIEYTPPWTLKEWRNAQLVSMHTYFSSRIIQDQDIPEDSDNEVEDYKSDDEGYGSYEEEEDSQQQRQIATQEETQPLYTQEVYPQAAPAPAPALEQNNKHKPRQRQRRIPHLSQTLHHVQNFEYLDLFTAQFDLTVCQITKVGKLRSTLRYLHTHTCKEECKVLDGRLPRMPFPHRQEDGPLACMYKDVTHLELTNKNGKRVYIFLYKQYAKLFDEWYQEQWKQKMKSKQKNAKFWIQLKQIPGVCVFPFAINPDNLSDTQKLVKYCICIGDGSTFQIPSKYCTYIMESNLSSQEDSTTVMTMEEDVPNAIVDQSESSNNRNGSSSSKLQRLRLDHPDMELRFFCATDTGSQYANFIGNGTMEFVLSQASLKDPAARHQRGDLVKEWKKYNDIALLNDDNVANVDKSTTNNGSFHDILSLRPTKSQNKRQHRQQQLEGTIQSKTVEMPLAPTDPDQQTITYQTTALKKDKPKDAPEYISLCELRNAMETQPEYTNFLFSVCAAVVGFTCGRRTKRGDWMMSATLVDQTSNETPTTLVVFVKDKADFPQISKAGDILHLHNIFLDEWNGKVQIGGRKGKSSYVVVRNEEGDDWKVIPTAKEEFCFDEDDEKKSQTLWHWTQHFLQQHSMIKPEHSFTLQQMVGVLPESNNNSDKDMVVMVSGLFSFPPEQQDGHTPYGILRIWDGTGQSTSDPLPMQLMSARHAQRQGDPPPEALKKISDVINALVAATGRQENGWQPPKALCGKVANAVVWEETYWDMIQKNLSVGSFVRMRNVEVRPWKYNGIMSIMVTDRSWLTPIPDESIEIGSLLRQHDKRVHRNEYNPDSGILPTSVLENNRRNDNIGKELVSFASNPDVMSFVGLVHLGDTYPKYDWDLKPFCKLSSDGSTFAY